MRRRITGTASCGENAPRAQLPARRTQRCFDAAGFPGRTFGLEAEVDKQKNGGK
jgi:hypothetical protein